MILAGAREEERRIGEKGKPKGRAHTCEPLVFLPAFAIERSPGLLCLSLKFSSKNTEQDKVISPKLNDKVR